jgi:hypothetical protein
MTFLCPFQGSQATLTLLAHSGPFDVLALCQVGDKIQVAIVAKDRLTLSNGVFGAVRPVFPAAGAYSNDEQFSLASATVIPLKLVLGNISSVR